MPWNLVPGVFIWISVAVAGMAMWTLAREWLPAPAAIAASVFFAADPYHQVMFYYRSDFAGARRLALAAADLGGAAPGSRRAALFARSRVDLCDRMAVQYAGRGDCYLLAWFHAARRPASRSARPLFEGVVAMLVGFALAAFYILPAAYEQRWVNISTAVADSLAPYRNFLFATNNELGFVQFNTRVSRVGIAMILVTLIAAIWTARRSEMRDVWLPLVAVSAFRPS